MILQATISPRLLSEAQQTWPVDPDFDWNGETTGSIVDMDAGRFMKSLRGLVNMEYQRAEDAWPEDRRTSFASTPRFRNQVAFLLWLAEQIDTGKEITELENFQVVEDYPNCWIELILMSPGWMSHGRWTQYLINARCPACAITYRASDLTEIEYDLFYFGEFLLVCPFAHHLCILGWQEYQLGG
ncbi:MAG: hypothetical protein MUF23_11960 [Pirellula sp.]|jgi:hypothetical protein|nr:hypothetical protein [Pirellula sp.]